LQESSRQLDLFGASLRTSPDTLASDSPTFTEAYEVWVSKLRLDFLAREKSALPIRGNGYLSWPTIAVSDGHFSECDHKTLIDAVRKGNRVTSQLCAIIAVEQQGGQPDPDSRSTNGKSRELLWGLEQVELNQWPTPRAAKPDKESKSRRTIGKSQVLQERLEQTGNKGKLNPAWVEQLMGLEIGWTDCDSWETVLCLNVQKKQLEY
jgi:hypothetical protein